MQLSLVLGAFFAVGAVLALRSLWLHAEQTEKPEKSKLKSSENVQHLYLFYCFTIVLFCLGILQALYFSLISSKVIFLFRANVMTLYHNCKLKLWIFKVGSKNFIHIHLTKESCKHFFPLHSYFTISGSIMLNITATDYCKCRSVFCGVFWLNYLYFFFFAKVWIWWCVLNDSFPKNVYYS